MDGPRGEAQQYALTAGEFVGLKLDIETTKRSVDDLNKKFDGVMRRLDDHMSAEEQLKKRVLQVALVIGVAVVLQALGVPVLDFIQLFKAV